MTAMAEKIRSRLALAFPDADVVIKDVSESHRGHAGYRDGGESHFDLVIGDTSFASMTRIARHRAVHAAIGREIMGEIHALAITIRD